MSTDPKAHEPLNPGSSPGSDSFNLPGKHCRTDDGLGEKNHPISHNTYTQTGGGQYNPQIQGVGEIANEGDVNMGSNTGATFTFNNQGNRANKQIQGVSGGGTINM